MGIYGVISQTCGCYGNWSTLDYKDNRTYMTKPCSQHSLQKGNMIYYELFHLFNHILKTKEGSVLQKKYCVKVLEVCEFNYKTLIKCEVNHSGDLKVENFDASKKMYFSQMNDQPTWEKIDDATFHLIFLYQSCHHTVEKGWEPFDY